jgi:hypothetical protein
MCMVFVLAVTRCSAPLLAGGRNIDAIFWYGGGRCDHRHAARVRRQDVPGAGREVWGTKACCEKTTAYLSHGLGAVFVISAGDRACGPRGRPALS